MTGWTLAATLAAAAGLPLFLTISIIALAGFYTQNLPLTLYFAELVRLAENPVLVAIPLFTVAGFILAASRASERLVRLADAVLGWMRGRLGVVALLLMALFTAFTGASSITIIALGGLLLPALLNAGYSERFSLGLLTSSGSIGLLFPPSLPIIIYGMVAGIPIEQLFRAGLAPGALLVLAVCVYAILRAPRQPMKKDRNRKGELWHALKESAFELPLPTLVVGGIYSGLFTVTEAATVSVAYLIIIECFILKDVHPLNHLPKVLVDTAVLVGGILVILGSALALTNVFIYLEVPAKIFFWIESFVSSRLMFLIILNVFLLLIGALMDIFSALVVVAPLILPVAAGFGVDPVHLAMVFLINLEIGYSTPPVGLNLYIASFRFERPVLQLYRAAAPFLLIQGFVLAVVTYIPSLTLVPMRWLNGSP